MHRLSCGVEKFCDAGDCQAFLKELIEGSSDVRETAPRHHKQRVTCHSPLRYIFHFTVLYFIVLHPAPNGCEKGDKYERPHDVVFVL
jgi:hypothetical protein